MIRMIWKSLNSENDKIAYIVSCVLPLLVIYDGDIAGWDAQNFTAVKQFLFASWSLIVVVT